MTAVQIVELDCDGERWFGDGVACHNHPNMDRWIHGLTALRRWARTHHGWTVRRRDGKTYDLCGDCTEEDAVGHAAGNVQLGQSGKQLPA